MEQTFETLLSYIDIPEYIENEEKHGYEHGYKDGAKAGAQWQKEQDKEIFQKLIPLVNALVYYSQIHTVTSVIPAGMPTHREAWKEAQQWLWDNCNIIDSEYILK